MAFRRVDRNRGMNIRSPPRVTTTKPRRIKGSKSETQSARAQALAETKSQARPRCKTMPTSAATTALLTSALARRRGFGAAYGEAVFDLDGQPFTLSTQIHIFGKR